MSSAALMVVVTSRSSAPVTATSTAIPYQPYKPASVDESGVWVIVLFLFVALVVGVSLGLTKVEADSKRRDAELKQRLAERAAEKQRVEAHLERKAAEHFALGLIGTARKREWEEQERILWEMEAPRREAEAARKKAEQNANYAKWKADYPYQ